MWAGRSVLWASVNVKLMQPGAYRDIKGGVFRASDQVSANEDCVALLNHGSELGVADWQHLIGCLGLRILCDDQLQGDHGDHC